MAAMDCFVDIAYNYSCLGVFPCKKLMDLTEGEIRLTYNVNTIALYWVSSNASSDQLFGSIIY